MQKEKFSTPTVEELRKNGYKVRVYHGRIFINDLYDSVIMSKREMDEKIITEEHVWNVGYQLSDKGGFTRVEISVPTFEGGEWPLLVGKYNVPAGHQFNRKLGLKVAIGRALKNHPQDYVYNIDCPF